MNTTSGNVTSLARRSVIPRSAPLRVLAVIALGAVLYFGRSAFIPIALAILFSLVLSTPVEALHRRGVPRSFAAILIMLLLLGLIGESVNLLWTPAQSWWASAPHTLRVIEKKIRPASQLLNRIEALSDRAGQITQPVMPDTSASAALAAVPPPPAVNGPVTPQSRGAATELLAQIRSTAVSIVTVIILTLFLLAGGLPMSARMSAALAGDLHSTQTLKVIDAVRREVSRYYVSIAMINIGLGAATGVLTMLLGMPNPLLWGTVACLLNFIPYVGSATTLVLLSTVAFVSFDSIGHVAAVAGGYLALTTIEGQAVQPLIVGHRLELNPIIVFLALWFGGWLWGIPGIVMAVPSLLGMKVVAEHSRNGKVLEEFLSPNQQSKCTPADGHRTVTQPTWQWSRRRLIGHDPIGRR
jgi:predicted PurR-regulated permease PerM